jgi:hypothetical protein
MKRFIHNRNHAAANIATALARKTLIAGTPHQILAKMNDRMEAVNRTPHDNSVLSEQQMSYAIPGSFSVFVKRTRRNTRRIYNPSSSLLQALPPLRGEGKDSETQFVYEIAGGIKINGRPYKSREYCEIKGAGETNKIAQILAFYKLGNDDDQEVVEGLILHVSFEQVIEVIDGVFIIRENLEVDEYANSEYISINLVHRKIKRALHWNDESCWCGVGMWRASIDSAH